MACLKEPFLNHSVGEGWHIRDNSYFCHLDKSILFQKINGPTSLSHTAANSLALSHFRNAIVSASHADIIHCA